MTYQPDCTVPTEFLEQLADGGLEALPEAIRLLINAAMLLERQKFMGAGPTSAPRSARPTPTASRPRPSTPASAASRSLSRRCAKAAFIPRAWTKASVANAR